jgi:hypothetical protein
MKLNRGLYVGKGLFVRAPLPDDNTLNAKRIGNVTIWVLLNDDFDSL